MSTKWKNFKEFVLVEKEHVCETVKSYVFKPLDSSPIPKHIPGQFMVMKVKTEDPNMQDVARCYSILNKPNEEFYKISVKKVDNGVMSGYLHDKLEIGDIIKSRIPMGNFVINEELPSTTPLVLISGGIGVTPLLSMLLENADKRNIHFIQAVQNSTMHPFKKEIENSCKKNNLKNTVFYSNPLDCDTLGKDFDVLGFVTKEWLKENTDLNSDYYFCGPPVFLDLMEKYLTELGVDSNRINFEKFC